MSAALDSDLALADEAATRALGAKIAAGLSAGDCVALWGPLGVGKTSFARGAAAAWTGRPDEEVPSPTFTLAQVYEGPRGALWHFDLYRLASPDQAFELGLEEALGEGASLIEWPERLGALLPARRLDVRLRFAEGGGRCAAIAAAGGFHV
jgi:tRNA threonylcarbamoyladenosine biosynthesis protein TsaE